MLKNILLKPGAFFNNHGFWKKAVSCTLIAGLTVSAAACGGKKAGSDNKTEPGVANEDVSQTEFAVMGAVSALSKGYDDNEVLNKMQEEAGVKIEWNVASDSVAEQVNVRIGGGELPDAFIAAGFNNYDLTNYGEDGTFIDLTPYLTEEYMPNLSKILEENPDIDYMHMCMAAEAGIKQFVKDYMRVIGSSGRYIYGEAVVKSNE